MQAIVTSEERRAVETFRDRLQTHFGARLKGCRLFGSKARAEGTPESDIDIVVLIDQMSYADKRWAITCGADVSLEFLVEISPLCLSPERFQHLLQRERGLALDIEREGISL